MSFVTGAAGQEIDPFTGERLVREKEKKSVHRKIGRGDEDILFISNRDGEPSVYALNSRNSRVRRLTEGVEYVDLAISPNGRLVAAQQLKSRGIFVGGVQSFILLIDLNEGKVEQLTNDGDFGEPAWFPDGSKLAVTSPDSPSIISGFRDIFIVGVSQRTNMPLVSKSGNSSAPSWSPDGRHLAYSSGFDLGSGFDIWIVDASNGEKTKISQANQQDSPSWSPDGKRIAYADQSADKSRICIMDADGRNVTPLTSGDNNDHRPRWSRDGKRIGFQRGELGKREIIVINSDGSEEKNLSSSPKDDFGLSWRR